MARLLLGDCVERMAELDDGSIDFVFTDPPFGVTVSVERWAARVHPIDGQASRAASVGPNNLAVDWAGWWTQVRRVARPGANVVVMGVQPFFTEVIASNLAEFKYDWVWEKGRVTGAFNAHRRPMTAHIGLAVFVVKAGRRVYNPQGRPDDPTIGPKTVVHFPSVHKPKHFSEKPLPLVDYFVRTYSDPGDTVLDPFMGSGTTGVAATLLGRDFVGIDLQPWCLEVAAARITRGS